MIETLISIAKPIDAPGSIPFLLICIGVGLCLMFVWPRNRRLGGRWLAAVAVFYLMLALPVVANAIAAPLDPTRDSSAAPIGALDALVVFDGDNRRGRVNAARSVHDASAPQEVWVLGTEADWIADELPKAGVPAAKIHMDLATGTTREQVQWVGRLRQSQPSARVAVVVSRLQVARTRGMMRAAQVVDVPVISAPVNREPARVGLRRFVPAYIALRVSRDAIYEHAALVYYNRKGWLGR